MELDHCSTYTDPPLCSQNGQKGQDCVCYYFCKSSSITPTPIDGIEIDGMDTALLDEYGAITMGSRETGGVSGNGNSGALFAYSRTNSRGQTYYLHSKEVSLRGREERRPSITSIKK